MKGKFLFVLMLIFLCCIAPIMGVNAVDETKSISINMLSAGIHQIDDVPVYSINDSSEINELVQLYESGLHYAIVYVSDDDKEGVFNFGIKDYEINGESPVSVFKLDDSLVADTSKPLSPAVDMFGDLLEDEDGLGGENLLDGYYLLQVRSDYLPENFSVVAKEIFETRGHENKNNAVENQDGVSGPVEGAVDTNLNGSLENNPDDETGVTKKFKFGVDEDGLYAIRDRKTNEYLLVYNADTGLELTPQTVGATTEDQSGVSYSTDKVYALYRDYGKEGYYIIVEGYETEDEIKNNCDFVRIKEGVSLFQPFEYALAWFVRSVANGFYGLVSSALGREITIDDIVFNNYDEVRLDFFREGTSTGINANDPGFSKPRASIIEAISGLINNWYSFFRGIAIAGYMVMLVYMAIRILLSVGAETKASFKTLIMHWVIGVAILFLYPYVMKYTILLSNAVVEMVEESKNNFSVNDFMPGITSDELSGTSMEDAAVSELPEEVGNKNNYMMKMKQNADDTRGLAWAVVYLIMVWQLVFLLVLYYKRMFMVALLITIFPLVALSYALDKVGDGKSQAFNTWTKEFMLNVIVQVFHAVVYVFCVSVSAMAGGSDWILMIIGISFLFKGEEIIKRIFGQTSSAGTVSSLAETAGKTIATVAIAKGAVTSVASKVSKTAGLVRSTWSGVRDRNMYANMERDFANYVSRGSSVVPQIPSSRDLIGMPDNPTDEELQFGQAIQTLNNPKLATPAALANALDVYNKGKNKGGNFEKLKSNLKMSDAQLERISNMEHEIADDIYAMSSYKDRPEMSQKIYIKIKAEAEIIDPDNADKLTNTLVIRMKERGFAKKRSIKEERIEREIEEAQARKTEMEDRVVFRKIGSHISEDDKKKKSENVEHANRIMENAVRASGNIDESQKADTKSFARAVVMLKNSDEGIYRADELMKAANIVSQKASLNDATREMVKELDFDVDEYRAVLASKVLSDIKGDNGSYRPTKEQVKTARAEAKVAMTDIARQAKDAEQNGVINIQRILNGDVDVEQERKTRRSLNQAERQITKDLARRIIYDNGIDETVNVDSVDSSNVVSDINESFSNESESFEPTLNGMTLSEIQEMKKISEQKVYRSLNRMGPSLLGSSKSSQKINVKDPYTGTIQEVELEGGFVYGGVNPINDPLVREQLIQKLVISRERAKKQSEIDKAYEEGKNS